MTTAEEYLEKIDCENTHYLLYGKHITLSEILDNYHAAQLSGAIKAKAYFQYETFTDIRVENTDLPEDFRLKDILIIVKP